MSVLLELVGKAALGELFKRVTEFAMGRIAKLPSFAGKDVQEGAEEFVRLNLKIPAGTSKADAQNARDEATILVIPSFEEILRLNPTIAEIERKSGIKRGGSGITAPAKKASSKKSVAKKVVARKAIAKKAVAKKAVAKKMVARKTVAKKVAVKKAVAKKAIKKTAAKKAIARRK